MNNVSDESKRSCTGCSICSVVCPISAISIKLTNQGFYEPYIDESRCVQCGKCKTYCYKHNESIKMVNNQIKTYSAINKNENVLKKSSSGGVSEALVNTLLDSGYIVLGVAYDFCEDIARTVIIESKSDAHTLRGSKYFQSYTEEAFDKALKDMSSQKYAIIGTPCQIYPIHNYLMDRGDRERFILVDLFCHGTPSLSLWKKYIDMIKRKMSVTKLDAIEFRSKARGWHRFVFSFLSGERTHVSPVADDPFYTLFFSKHAFNLACYDCPMRSTVYYTDLRLGDYWGYRYDTNKTGVSAIVSCSSRGEQLLSEVGDSLHMESVDFEEVVSAQSYGKVHEIDEEMRNLIMKLLETEDKIEDVIRQYKKALSITTRWKVAGKSVLKRLPLSVSGYLKSIYHRF